jgi:low temperature requirement protein LtrA
MATLLRTRSGHGHARVTSIELFFDLVFVFAVTQLSHYLLEDFTGDGALHTGLLLMAVWWVWVYTSWATNWLDPERIPVRLLLFACMLVGLLLSASIPAAFSSRGLVFGAAYAAIQVGRTAFVLWAVQHDPRQRRNFQRILTWLVGAGILWVAGGLAEGSERLALWASGLFLDYLGPIAGYWLPWLGRSRTEEWDVEGGHMAERCGLFIIIALGESILVTGATFAGLEWTAQSLGALVAAFVGSVAMWWIYFDTTAEAASETISTSADPGRLARSAYTYLHLPIVAGIIVAAVGDELVLAHPSGHVEAHMLIAIAGGPAIYLCGTALFRWAIARSIASSHVIGLVALGMLPLVSAVMTPLTLTVASTLILASIAVWDACDVR